MQIIPVIAFSILTGIAFRGSKVTVALYALQLGANPLMVGVLAAGYSVFPLLLAVHAGRTTDRFGVRYPLLLGSIGLAGGLILPLALPSLAGLLAAVTLLGVAHIYYHVAIHYAVGSAGSREDSARNFANFSLGASVSAFIGPAATGFAIDHAGYSPTLAMLGSIAAVPAVVLAVAPRLLATHARESAGEKPRGAFDLLRHAPLRRVLWMSGAVLTGLELFVFYMPIYGRAIGASASAIGVVLASYAAAAFVVRTVMPHLSRRLGPERLLASALVVGAASYLLFPLFARVELLMLIAFAMGLGLGLGQPLTIMMTYERSPPGRSGEALGMRLTVNKVMQVAIPLVFGSLGTAFGVFPVFWACAGVLGTSGWLGLRGPRRVEAPTS